MSPVSVFDERLEEDPRVNRLEDSITLWSSICETPLLANTQLILFLNKCDLLQNKLDAGVEVVNHIPSYCKRPNDLKCVVKCASSLLSHRVCGPLIFGFEDMREKFKTIHREKSPSERTLYIYPTTVTDTISTSVTLEAGIFSIPSLCLNCCSLFVLSQVRDNVVRRHIATSQLM